MTAASRGQPWREAWFKSVQSVAMRAWRAVEAQHAVATMRLVDSLDEQEVLERLLESSKPPLPAAARSQHYLLVTPFRYRPRHGSRFRRAGSPGIWYGAQEIRTACAESAYWRWRFLVESSGLQNEELLTEHTVFAAAVHGPAIDLAAKPWNASRRHWTHPDDYTSPQNLADAARERGVGWLRYESARDPGGVCCAVFSPDMLSGPDLKSQQTWHCRATRDGVRMIHDSDRFEWSMKGRVR